ncbi:hypothetical protein DFH06DRAFT_1119369 [Mycena polygramma]|nr:hypothetical protein DFH06DRAFT_1119369 [Mycena polygramma]
MDPPQQQQSWYAKKKEVWVPWAEDQYLYWFGKDNKASYATKDTLGKSKVTGIEQVDTAQDGINNLVGGQIGKGGIGESVGNAASKGITRSERGGKDDDGSYLGAAGGYASSAAQSVGNAGGSVGSKVGGLMGGNKAESKDGK